MYISFFVVCSNFLFLILFTFFSFQDAGIGGLNSKTHMKIMLKWMRGRKMLKLFCTHVGSSKKFLHCTLPEDAEAIALRNSLENQPQTPKHSVKKKK